MGVRDQVRRLPRARGQRQWQTQSLFAPQEAFNRQYRYIFDALHDLPQNSVVDGEVVALDDAGRPNQVLPHKQPIDQLSIRRNQVFLEGRQARISGTF